MLCYSASVSGAIRYGEGRGRDRFGHACGDRAPPRSRRPLEAIAAGTDVAVEAGDVVLVGNDRRDVPRTVALNRATYRKMIQNLWWAAGYNVIAIPLAAGAMQPWGGVLSPVVGAVLMSLSTIVVAINAQLLRRTSL